MKLGFNSNVQRGDGLFHVQTEVLGLTHPFIDTVVLSEGRVLHRRSTSYSDLLAGAAPDPAALEARVEQQHRAVLEALAANSLVLEAPLRDVGIALKLRNAASWLAHGHASLEVEVREHNDGPPVANADVEVLLEGVVTDAGAVWKVRTDDAGLARLTFPLPPFADATAAALVIRAGTPRGHAQLRYHLKPKPRDGGSSQ